MSNSGLLKDSTRILVTHRRNVVSKADYVLVSHKWCTLRGVILCYVSTVLHGTSYGYRYSIP